MTLRKLLIVALQVPLLFIYLFANSYAGEMSHGLSLYGPQDLKYKPGESYEYANPNAPKGGQLILSSFGGFTKLNPVSLKGVAAPFLGGLVFQTPMDTSKDDDEPFSLYGDLVEKVELSDDRMSMIYHLNKKAKFSDGHPVTADDFVFSFEIIKDPQYVPHFKQYFQDIKQVEKLGTYKVKYTFAVLNQELPLITGQMFILPKHIYGQPGKRFGSDFDDIAVGSGPYTVEKYEFGKYITLKRNPDWWARDLANNRGRYNFDRITTKIFLDPVAQREAFKGGEYDAKMVNSSRDWALDYQGDFVKKKYYLRERFPHKRVSGMQGFAMNTRRDIFKSRRVRAALAMVYDFEWANKNLFYNQYTRSDCYFDNDPELKPRGSAQGEVKKLLLHLRAKHGSQYIPKTAITKPVGAPGQGQPAEKNIALANKLLESAGWKMSSDGIRMKNGKPLKFEMLLFLPFFQRVVEPYKSNLKKIGAQMDVKLIQAAQYEERVRAFKYDMIVVGYGQSRSPGNEQRNYWSSAAADLPGSRNFSGIKNPAVDELVDKIIDARTRKELAIAIQAMDRVLTHQYFTVPHWYTQYDRLVYWNKFSRPKVNASQTAILNNVIEWWWWDDDKAKKLEEARSRNQPLN